MTKHNLPVSVRFWLKVDKSSESGCWIWQGSRSRNGYGQFWDGTKYPSGARRIVPAHRFAYDLTNGPAPIGYVVDHQCHNRACVNPSHLRPATLKQNAENRRGANRTSVSGIRGVRQLRSGRWIGRVRHLDVLHEVGPFDSAVEAESAVSELRSSLFTHSQERVHVLT